MLLYHLVVHYHTIHTLQSLKGKRRILETNDRLPLSIFLNLCHGNFSFFVCQIAFLTHPKYILHWPILSPTSHLSFFLSSSSFYSPCSHVRIHEKLHKKNVSSQQKVELMRAAFASHTFILHHHHAKFINAAYAKRMYLYQNFRSKPKPTKLNVLFCSFSDQIMKLRELNKSKHEANISTHTDILRFRNIAM